MDAFSPMTVTLADLIDAAGKVHLSASTAYREALAAEAQSRATAAATKTGMPEGYWQRAHVARLRFEAARALDAALREIEP